MTPTSLGRRVLLFIQVCLYLLFVRAQGPGVAASFVDWFSPLGEGLWAKVLAGMAVACCGAISLAVLALVDFALVHFVFSKRQGRTRLRDMPQRA